MKVDNLYRGDAIDLIADLLEPASVIMQDKKIADILQTETYVGIAVYILKHHKEQAIKIVCVINGEDPDTWEFNAWDVLRTLMNIIENPQIAEVFGLQSQNEQSTGFGSVTAITTEEGL